MSETEADMELPWVLDPERKAQPGARPRLDNVNLFLIAVREAFRDGEVTEVENKLLGQFAKALKISSEKASKLAKLAKKEWAEGKTTGTGEADKKTIFLKACKFAAVDGEIDAGERTLLESFGRGLGLDAERLDGILARALAEAQQGEDPGAAAAPPAEAADAEPAETQERDAVAPEDEALESTLPAEGAAAVAAAPKGDYKVEVDIELPDIDILFDGL